MDNNAFRLITLLLPCPCNPMKTIYPRDRKQGVSGLGVQWLRLLLWR